MIIQFIGYLISASVLILFAYCRGRRNDSRRSDPLCWLPLAIGILTVSIGTMVRIIFFNLPLGGHFSFEEISASINYVGDMLRDAPTITGGTNFTFFLLSAAWQRMFGPSLVSIRFLSTAIGLIGLVFLYCSQRRLADKNAALITVGLAAINTTSTFYSQMAIETGWPIALLPLSLYLYSKTSADNHRGIWAGLFGLSIAVGVFTYPGYTVGFVAATPFVIIHLFKNRDVNFKLAMCMALGFALFSAVALTFHFHRQPLAVLFRGGGVPLSSTEQYLSSLGRNLADIFGIADSYYLSLGTGFVESSQIGFCILGVWHLVFRERKSWAFVLFGAMLLIPLISATAYNFPGMRRGIAFLPIFLVFAGSGLALFMSCLKQFRPRWIGSIGIALCFATVLTSVVSLANSLHTSANSVSTEPLAQILQHKAFNTWLDAENFTIVLSDRGSENDFAVQYLRSYAFLQNRFKGKKSGSLPVVAPEKRAEKSVFKTELHAKGTALLLIEGPNTLKFFESQFCLTNAEPVVGVGALKFFLTQKIPCTQSLVR